MKYLYTIILALLFGNVLSQETIIIEKDNIITEYPFGVEHLAYGF